MTRSDLSREYFRREQEAGGVHACDPKEIAQDIARDHDLTYEEVRDMLLDAFSMAGSG